MKNKFNKIFNPQIRSYKITLMKKNNKFHILIPVYNEKDVIIEVINKDSHKRKL
jgi:hypothetical protein